MKHSPMYYLIGYILAGDAIMAREWARTIASRGPNVWTFNL